MEGNQSAPYSFEGHTTTPHEMRIRYYRSMSPGDAPS
uniref:Uncharacterized protein n=1 Tax=Anguilla anguilla TaxID=7936 RepID=A0A0E9RBU9_ANGAN